MKPRGRPKKTRVIKTEAKISQFSPRGKPGRPDERALEMDEFEALRLADFKGVNQKEAARSMKISQQTFSRILGRARKAVADAIVSGKIIRIQGGKYVLSSQKNFPPNPQDTNPRHQGTSKSSK